MYLVFFFIAVVVSLGLLIVAFRRKKDPTLAATDVKGPFPFRWIAVGSVIRDIQLMTSNELCEPGQREAYTMMRED